MQLLIVGTGILEDDHGNIWLSTHNGLAKFERALSNPNTSYFRTFSVQEGLQGAEFKIGSYLKDRHGIMYFGGQNGYNSFDPDLIVEDPNIPPVVITNFKVFNQDGAFGDGELLPKPILELNEIVLTHRESVFTSIRSPGDGDLPAVQCHGRRGCLHQHADL